MGSKRTATMMPSLRGPPLIPWLAIALLVGCIEGAAQGLPETLTGRAEVFDGVTFDLVSKGGRYRTTTRIRPESVDACELRQKTALDGVKWPCGVVATAWLVSQTLARDIECRPTRSLKGGGYRAQCYLGALDIGAAGLEHGMYSLSVPAGEQPLPGYRGLEWKAKAAGVGIWSSRFTVPAEWRRSRHIQSSGASPMKLELAAANWPQVRWAPWRGRISLTLILLRKRKNRA